MGSNGDSLSVVTLFLTDVEGSTRLWEVDQDAMSRAVARHDELVGRIVPIHGGTVVKPRGEGDSLFCVFLDPLGALRCATSLQDALTTESWPTVQPLRVRVAIHTGRTEARDGDFYGQTVNRCARIRAVGHGGQVLVSNATAELVRESLPPDYTLRDLGSHRLKDLARSERIFQLAHPALKRSFRPLQSLDPVRHNLPVQLTSFVGRDEDLRIIRKLLAERRLVTLHGTGGAGKTRLAIQVAAEALEAFEGGAWLVELTRVDDPSLVGKTLADALVVVEEAGLELAASLRAHLNEKPVLLVLDNCEHVVDGVASLVADLLSWCAEVRVLATSRLPLGVPGEVLHAVTPLPAPDETADAQSMEGIDAVRLFVQRAALVKPAFSLTDDVAHAVARICRRLDGLPLGIELAAVRLRTMGVAEIDARLDDRFRLLASGTRTATPRQQTLAAAVEWSYDLLHEPERIVLRRLAVFAGEFRLDDAEAVCPGEDPFDIADALTCLVDHALVVLTDQGRYRLLETIRSFAHDRLVESGEVNAAMARHAVWCSRRAAEADGALDGPDSEPALVRLDELRDDARTALAWCAQHDRDRGLYLSAVFGRYWYRRGHWTEGRRWLDDFVADEREPSSELGVALWHASLMAGAQGERDRARSLRFESGRVFAIVNPNRARVFELEEHAQRADDARDFVGAISAYETLLATCSERGDPLGQASALYKIAVIARRVGDYDRAHRAYSESLRLYAELGRDAIGALHGLAQLEQDVFGRYDEARAHLERALEASRRRGFRSMVADGVLLLAQSALYRTDYSLGQTLATEALEIHSELGSKYGLENAFYTLGLIAWLQADSATAATYGVRSLHLARELDSAIGRQFAGLGALAGFSGDAERCARLFGTADREDRLRGTKDVPFAIAVNEAARQTARAKIGDEAYAKAYAEGEAMSIDDAVAYASEMAPS